MARQWISVLTDIEACGVWGEGEIWSRRRVFILLFIYYFVCYKIEGEKAVTSMSNDSEGDNNFPESFKQCSGRSPASPKAETKESIYTLL